MNWRVRIANWLLKLAGSEGYDSAGFVIEAMKHAGCDLETKPRKHTAADILNEKRSKP